LREEHKKQIPRCARNDRLGDFSCPFGGPKAHVTLSMTGTLFHQPARLDLDQSLELLAKVHELLPEIGKFVSEGGHFAFQTGDALGVAPGV
jgi:hypothetical protein